MGMIRITNMRFYTKNGVFQQEKELGQQIAVDVALTYPIETAVKNDDLTTTISYADVYADIKSYIETHQFNLIESLANGLLETLLARYQTAEKIHLNIRKYAVPMEGVYDDVEISVEGMPH